MRLLSRREHSRAELAAKLQATAGEGEDIDGLLDSLESSGLLSDARYAEGRARVRGGGLGDQRLAHELRQRGVAAELIETTLSALPDEADRARAAWQRRFGTRPLDRADWAKQARFLQSRGFAVGTIRRVLDSPDEDEP